MRWNKDYVFLIGAVIYVAGMFPLYYVYQVQGNAGWGLIDLISTFGVFLVMGQAFFALVPDNKKSTQVPPPETRNEIAR